MRAQLTAAEAATAAMAKGAGKGAAEGHISPLSLRTALDRSTGGGYVTDPHEQRYA